MKKVFLLLISIFLFGCTKIEEPDLNKLMKENQYVIVDVRTEAEYKNSHLVGAVNIPVDDIDENIDLDKDKLIFVYCKSGNRSKTASIKLENLGYKTYDLGALENIDLPQE